MFVVAICVAVHSVLGLPWYVAATVSALAHINSLRKESKCTAPGEKPTFLGVRYILDYNIFVVHVKQCIAFEIISGNISVISKIYM